MKNKTFFALLRDESFARITKGRTVLFDIVVFFSDLLFFVKFCDRNDAEDPETASYYASRSNEVISRLRNFLGFDLFLPGSTRCEQSLTQNGQKFLANARKMVTDIVGDISDKSEEKNSIVIKTDILNGKSFVLPYIASVSKQDNYVNVNLITHENYDDLDDSDAHVLFCSVDNYDESIFDKKWSVRIEQGLYASNEYLREAGRYPKKDAELLEHSVLGYGDSFYHDCSRSDNWHLFGEYFSCSINPSIMINSWAVLMAAVKAGLGIGPMAQYHHKTKNPMLCRILPSVSGPSVFIDFIVRRDIDKKIKSHVNDVEESILKAAKKAELEVICY